LEHAVGLPNVDSSPVRSSLPRDASNLPPITPALIRARKNYPNRESLRIVQRQLSLPQNLFHENPLLFLRCSARTRDSPPHFETNYQTEAPLPLLRTSNGCFGSRWSTMMFGTGIEPRRRTSGVPMLHYRGITSRFTESTAKSP
jgi:hypothetical protein